MNIRETKTHLSRLPNHELLFNAASIWKVTIETSLGRNDFRVEPRVLSARPSR